MSGRALAVAGLFALLAQTGARAADSDPFDYRQHTLSNGLVVLTLEDFSCPVVAVQLWYHVGSKDEQPDRQGFAHMFEHMMFRGTSVLGPTDHFDLLRRTGGTCNAYTAFDQTVYHEIVPANQLELALWLEAERMAFLKIDQESFDTERKVVEEERRLGLNQPYGSIPEKLLAEVFTVHPYRWSPIGKIPHLRAASVPELRAFWNRFYVPNNGTLVIAGAVTHDAAKAAADRYFGWIPRYGDPPRVSVREPELSEARVITIRDDNAPLAAVGVAFRTVPVGHVDLIPLQLLATILGGDNSSRLYRELVADKQISVVAMAAAYSLEQEGAIGAGAALSPLGGDAAKARQILEAQLARLRGEPISERELLKAKNQMRTQLARERLTVDGKASALGSAAVLEGDASRVQRRLADIEKVTVDDLTRVARTYLVPEREYRLTIERNLLGSLFGRRGAKEAEESAPITAPREEFAPPPGRNGLKRPLGLPTKAPLAATRPELPKNPIVTRQLPNGMKVRVATNHEAPIVEVLLGLRVGAWTETKPGVASMTLGMLTQGTTAHSEAALADELGSYAISLSGGAGTDSSTVNLSCLKENLDKGMGLLAEVVLTPTFPEDEFKKLKKQRRASLMLSSAQAEYVAERELRRVLFGAHPYARTATGEVADIDAIEVADCREWWRRNARPDQVFLIFSGAIEPDEAMALASGAFQSWTVSEPWTPPELPAPPPAAATRIYLVDRPGSIQSQIRAGQLAFARSDAAYPRARVVGGYFGGAFNSRLNDTIRVKRGLTYGARGGFETRRFGGQFIVATFTKTESTAETVKAVLGEIDRLKNEPPSAGELHNTVAYLLGSLARERETPTQIASELVGIEINGLPDDDAERTLAQIEKTAEGDCMRLIADSVDPARMAIVVVGDASRLQEPLSKIAPVELVRAAESPKTSGQ